MSEVIEQYRHFLSEALPRDYDDGYDRYRHDHVLRRDFQIAEFENGWLVPEWNSDHGGRDLNAADALDVRLTGAQRRIPRHLNIQGVGVAAPALRQYGTDDQQRRLLRSALRGDEWWALGMSEPEAGSDLASLRTTGTLHGDTIVVTGQKIWTTQADESRWCTLYVRTDRTAPPHRGISCLILDMTSPGVTVRPIPTSSPAIESFCEVFLDAVEIPATALLGQLNAGWQVAMSSLQHERDMIWINTWLESRRALEPALRSPDLPEHSLAELGKVLADTAAIRYTGLRAAAHRITSTSARFEPILKLVGSETVQHAARFSFETTGPTSADNTPLVNEMMESLAATIYGGTSEVQRNIIAERILGLPKS
ncbi:acyl-CoA dehydrogenase family protein [Gordonia sp. zg691]|uniref:acyl-CoA dehydrogenase family protein n=1 Tax=Gordonia jinghuaiqii TaxID=2758710 RepID=UPI0016626275|nr:acyl-CoA dehydrogenase family protein [Gordonia jinghuaiqii]MBD0860488.1 acyl-CoA dehydrogenase family protein [Gordonia jinghuaiqii]